MIKKLFLLFVLAVAFMVWFVYDLDRHISTAYEKKIYSDVSKVPHKRVAIVLGTSKYAWGRENLYYLARIDAVVKLFKANKIDAIVVSGDNGSKNYDEPSDMRDDLIKRGIPKQYITLDYAGFRTLDSIMRAKKVFCLDDFIIVSQKFHIQRALYICDKKEIKAIGFRANDVQGFFAKKIATREKLARFKAFLDIFILKTEPKFYGKKEKVVYRK